MANHAEEMLQRGSALLAPLLLRHGFLFKVVDTVVAAAATSPPANSTEALVAWSSISATVWVWSRTVLLVALRPTSSTGAQYTEAWAQATIQVSQAIHSTLFSIYFSTWRSSEVIFSAEQTIAC
jgi:hypothetical protein